MFAFIVWKNSTGEAAKRTPHAFPATGIEITLAEAALDPKNLNEIQKKTK